MKQPANIEHYSTIYGQYYALKTRGEKTMLTPQQRLRTLRKFFREQNDNAEGMGDWTWPKHRQQIARIYVPNQ